MIRDIAGRQNHSVKSARKLQKKKYRREWGLLVGEGMDLLRAAVDAGAVVRDVLVRRDLLEQIPPVLVATARESGGAAGVIDIGICDSETLDYASSLGGAADVVFTCTEPSWSLADLPLGSRMTLFLDEVGDPGNVGTLVRSLVAFGGGGLICSPGTADPFGPKAMRAGMGAQFLTPVVTEVSPADLRARMAVLEARAGVSPEVLVADPHAGDDLRVVMPRSGVVVVLGSERTGAGGEWSGARRVRIPQSRFDSLNVAMAGTIIAYELWRAADATESGKS